MTGKSLTETVEPAERPISAGQIEASHAQGQATLPWEAPPLFRNVPAHAGPLRSPNPVGFRATNDVEAVAAWFAERASGSPNTAIAYRKEVERLLFWLADQGMSLSDATREDFTRYARFLLDPRPAKKWVSDGGRHKRESPKWKPFTGPLSPTTAQQSLAICQSLIKHLHSTGWLIANTMPEPKRLIKHEAIDRSEMVGVRQVPQTLFKELFDYATRHEQTNGVYRDAKATALRTDFVRARLRVVLAFSGILAARSSDLTNAYMTDIRARSDGHSVKWVWHISQGKGSKDAMLRVPKSVMDNLALLRLCVGLTPHPEPGEPPCPLIPREAELPKNGDRVDPRKLKPLTRSGLYRQLDKAFSGFANELKLEGRKADAQIIDQMSAHWLRHTAIKRMVDATGSLTLARKLARHSSITTTSDYAAAISDEVGDALESLDDLPTYPR